MNTCIIARLASLAAISCLTIAGESAFGLSFTTIEAGANHSCGITAERQLWCWGRNSQGSLGIGETDGLVVPTPRPVGLQDVTAVAIGVAHTCAIAGGRVWCWGINSHGQLGTTDVELGSYRSVPVQVGGELAGRTDAAVISARNYTSCAIVGGNAYCWGRGDQGQIGDGMDTSTSLPAAVLIGSATTVSVGMYHACAIAEGSAYCWGFGGDGALGYGSSLSSSTPVAVVGIPNAAPVERLAAGSAHTCATSEGKAYCWGLGAYGRLGTGNTANSTVAIPVWNQAVVLTGVAAGGAHTCASDSDGRLWCWGSDGYGQLGNDLALQEKWVPTPVAYLEGVTSMSAGTLHTCAIAEGVAFCWGSNASSQLGTGGPATYAQVPIQVDVNCEVCVDYLFRNGFD